jgi:hypothetical protein
METKLSETDVLGQRGEELAGSCPRMKRGTRLLMGFGDEWRGPQGSGAVVKARPTREHEGSRALE